MAIVVSFLDEAEHLPTFLASLAVQTRLPDVLLLVDDGSGDGSDALAERFTAERGYARLVRRPPRPPERDRLARAAELGAFHAGVADLPPGWDVVVKLDADLQLAPDLFATVMGWFEADPRLGVAGSYLSQRRPGGRLARENHPPDHVRGPNKFYRRECLGQIEPLPEILGWDTIDDISARMHGWRTQSIEVPSGDTVHLRPTGTRDGRLRAFRRWGLCAWGFGATPLYMAMSVAYHVRDRPYGLATLHYLWGYAQAAVQRAPRVQGPVLAYSRWEQRRRIRRVVGSAVSGRG